MTNFERIENKTNPINIQELLKTNSMEQTKLWLAFSFIENIYNTELKKLEKKFGKIPNDEELEEFVKYIKKNRSDTITKRNLNEIVEEANIPKIALLKIFSNGLFLDIGSSGSSFSEEINSKLSLNSKVVSLDIRHKEISYKGADEPKLVADSVKSLPFRANEFDSVLASWSLPIYTDSPSEVDRFFKQIRSILKVGGCLVVYPIVFFNSRIPKDIEGKKIGPKDQTEQDPRVNYVLYKNSLIFYELLLKAQKLGEFEIVLVPAMGIPGLPSTAVLKKLR